MTIPTDPTPFATSMSAVERRLVQHLGTASALIADRRHAEAIDECRRAMTLGPDDARPWINMGVARLGMRDFDAAITCYERALELDPTAAVAMDNIAVAHRMKSDVATAIKWHRRAVELDPDRPSFRRNLAGALEASGDWDAAMEAFEHLLAADPADRESRIGRGLGRLYRGDMGGMADLDARLDHPVRLMNELPGIPRWDGLDLGGKTLLVNQYVDGFGDAIQGIRSAPTARERCGRLVVACHKDIARLLERADGVDHVISDPAEVEPFLPDIAAQCPPLGLPWYCGLKSLDEIPGLSRVPYLTAEPDRVRWWRYQMVRVRGPWTRRIGIVWQGSPTHSNDANRSFRLEEFAPLAAIPNVELIALQKGVGADQVGQVDFDIRDLNHEPEYRDGDLLETAAAMSALDLVISADTGLAHLAAAIGRPTWVALPKVAEWRWLSGRDDTPWYPAARLWRQEKPSDWQGVFRRMAETLSTMV